MEIHKAENEKICEHTIWIFVIYGCLSFLGQIASRKALVMSEVLSSADIPIKRATVILVLHECYRVS